VQKSARDTERQEGSERGREGEREREGKREREEREKREKRERETPLAQERESVALGLARERKGENERMGGWATMGRGTGGRERGYVRVPSLKRSA
jgi:hypothetical protein